jgi:mono/diheme cytochrome c family protein
MKSKSAPSSGMLFRGFGSIVAGSTVRHNQALRGGVPAPYATMRNPMPPSPVTAELGGKVYQAQCASCHGETGLGDGPASRALTPPPAQLGWIARIRPAQRDGFLYWAIAEGGQPFGTGMPSFKGKLSDDDIWSVIGYIQARLPQPKAAGR